MSSRRPQRPAAVLGRPALNATRRDHEPGGQLPEGHRVPHCPRGLVEVPDGPPLLLADLPVAPDVPELLPPVGRLLRQTVLAIRPVPRPRLLPDLRGVPPIVRAPRCPPPLVPVLTDDQLPHQRQRLQRHTSASNAEQSIRLPRARPTSAIRTRRVICSGPELRQSARICSESATNVRFKCDSGASDGR